MAYEMVMPYHLHMPSYFLETFTEYPFLIGRLSRFLLNAKGILSINFYRRRQWTVRFTVVDCTVCYSGLYSLPSESVLVFRTKVLNHTGKTY